jgi:predicted nucleic acid-binding protein
MFEPTMQDIMAAKALSKSARLIFMDAMMVQAAAQSGCRVLWTENLENGRIVKGVEIRNPFLDDTIRAAFQKASSPS